MFISCSRRCSWRESFGLLAKFGQHAQRGLRVQEGDVQALGALAGSFVDEAHAFFFSISQGVGHAVFNGKCQVVHAALAAVLFDELGDGAFRRCRLQ